MDTHYKVVLIEDITINRPERQRKELKDLEQLAKSIQVNGLINPPVVTPDLVLIAGERRVTACRDHLGYTHITVGIRDSEPTAAQRKVELAENVERLELEWKDRCFAVREFHELAQQDDPEWSMEDSAKALNMGSSSVSRHINLAKELDAGTPLICGAPQFSVALNILERMRERKAQAETDKLRSMIGSPKPQPVDPLADLDISLPEEMEPETPVGVSAPPFRCSDFLKFSQTYRGTPFNFLHCDFPYGVNADKHRKGKANVFGGYEDTADVYWELIDALGNAMDTLVSEHAHMMFWFSMDYYAETVEKLTAYGWTVNPFPLIWFKSDNSGILPDPKRGPRRNYETALLCTRGDRKIIQAVSNVAAAPITKNIHMSEKPMDMLQHFFRMFVDETTNMLDPTMGSGNAVVLAEYLGANARGLEKDKEFYERARDTYLARGYPMQKDK